MIGLDGEKMSKSKGNLVFVSRLRADGVDSMAVRLGLMSGHYRDALTQAGLEVRQDNRVLTVVLGESGDAVYDLIRDAIADLDLSLHRLERQRHQVADLFRDLPTDDRGVHHANA